MRDYFAPFLMRKDARIGMLVGFAVLSAVSGWAVTHLVIDFDSRLFVADDHEL